VLGWSQIDLINNTYFSNAMRQQEAYIIQKCRRLPNHSLGKFAHFQLLLCFASRCHFSPACFRFHFHFQLLPSSGAEIT